MESISQNAAGEAAVPKPLDKWKAKAVLLRRGEVNRASAVAGTNGDRKWGEEREEMRSLRSQIGCL
jgi:hypothetical protein